ncbi:hypothetical protein CK820_G0001705 [Pan troglodytes]|uniref:Uncharacterized protein n=1 Tax=Pan troglodytes TaxID=9598 RepID=A0A2J8PRS8_PANTR|nr:hypothetical protein CK820_G0001705 [Pan troglodytes]
MFPRLVSNSWTQAICPPCLPKCSSKKGVCRHTQPEQLLFLRLASEVQVYWQMPTQDRPRNPEGCRLAFCAAH